MPEKKKAGRPKKNMSKKVQVNVRLDDKDLKKLVRLMDVRDLTASEALSLALNLAYDLIF